MYWCWPYPHNDFCQHRGNTTSKLGPHRLASSRCHCGGCWLVKSQTKGLTGIFGYDQLAKGIFHPKAKSWPSICCRPWRAKQSSWCCCRLWQPAAIGFQRMLTHFTEHKLNLRQKVWLAILVMSPKGYVIPRLKAGHHSVIQSLYLYLYLLWSVTGKTEQLMLLQAVTVGSSAI